ncbi:terminase large subunit domain-containing protein [Providencia rettgeri]|uniref:terminase large subunit domain-containing protein n=1 Tax=Providencia rettgeri TaxID=587 RepID=UPI0011869BED|nr:terminase family protein [Providencia rettgeri]
MFKINVTSELLIRLAYKMHTDVNDWQERWSNNQFHRNRVLNKARQIGSSWYFSLEALNDACLTGRNKIFIGDNLLIQNEIQYLCYHANQMKYEDLIDCFEENNRLIIQLNNGAKIYFISTMSHGVSGITGDVYVPEWSWNSRPSTVLALAQGIENHKKWRITFYSTRSKLDNASQLNIEACNSENVFIDRVNLFQATLDHVTCYDDIQKGSERFHPEAFGEMYLCAFSGG